LEKKERTVYMLMSNENISVLHTKKLADTSKKSDFGQIVTIKGADEIFIVNDYQLAAKSPFNLCIFHPDE